MSKILLRSSWDHKLELLGNLEQFHFHEKSIYLSFKFFREIMNYLPFSVKTIRLAPMFLPLKPEMVIRGKLDALSIPWRKILMAILLSIKIRETLPLINP